MSPSELPKANGVPSVKVPLKLDPLGTSTIVDAPIVSRPLTGTAPAAY